MGQGFDDQFVTLVRDRTNIVAVVGDYVSLRKAGTSYKGLCPFHSEKSPSFTVHEDRQFFYCFGCQTGGDAINFVREINGYSFVEALKHLAERAGLDIPEPKRRPGDRSRDEAPKRRRLSRSERGSYYEVGRIATRFFTDTLKSMEGSRCRDYLRDRGITTEAIERFALGCAPDRWDGLCSILSEEQIPMPLAETLGLAVSRNGGGHYDRFRDRLIFPIRSTAGEPIAFGGRRLSNDKETAKYVNSPDSPVYQKGDTLFGLYEARTALRKQQAAVVVEGNLDLVRLSQEGIEHVVAPMGTALTPTQCRLIKRFVPRAVLLYDGDDAGRAAALKAIPTMMAEGVAVSVVLLPPGEDPDSFVASRGAAALLALIDKPIDGWHHLVEQTIERTHADHGVQGVLSAIDALLPALEGLSDRRARELYERTLAQRLGIQERELVRMLRDSPARKRRQSSPARASEPAAPVQPPTLERPPVQAEFELLKLLLLAPETCALYLAHDVGRLVTHDRVRSTADELARRCEEEGVPDPAGFVSNLEPGPLREQLFLSLTNTPKTDDWTADFALVERALERRAVKRDMERSRRELQRAFQASDDETVARLQLEQIAIQRQLENLRATQG